MTLKTYNDEDFRDGMALQPRHIPDEQMRTYEGYMAEIFTAFGTDLNTPATADTPRRFVKALLDATDGYDGDPDLRSEFFVACGLQR
jgi:GTP cyclohydrolase I